jgi:predicted nucleic acid-binding protein
MTMQTIHLDTNFLIYAGQTGHPVQAKLTQWRGEGRTFAVSTMAWAEYLCGPLTPAMQQSWEQLLSGSFVQLDEDLSKRAASLFNLTGRRSRSLPDCIVAACAIRAACPVATVNTTDFAPFVPHGLTLI